MNQECTKCHRRLPSTEFYVTGAGVRQSACKACAKLAVAEWRAKNRERHNENARRWRQENPDKIKATNREQYEKNREARDEYGRRWAKDNINKRRGYEKKWRDKDASKTIMRARVKKWRLLNPAKAAAAERKWRQQNPDAICAFAKTRRARKRGAPVNDFTSEQWASLQVAYGQRCAYCDRRCKGRLTQDHVVPLSKGGSHTASNIVPACGSCNSRKHTGPPLRPVQTLLLVP